MDEKQLVCIMAAIIYSTGRDPMENAAYSPEGAVRAARFIIDLQSELSPAAEMQERRQSWEPRPASEGM